jgi:hypothetical protein
MKEYSEAFKAWSIQDITGWPSTNDFIRYVEGNMLPNLPIFKADMMHILEQNLGC